MTFRSHKLARRPLLVVSAGLALALTACGSDDQEPAPVSQADLTIEAKADNSFAYQSERARAEAGELTIAFDNPASLQHDVRIESPDGQDLGGTEVISGDETSFTIELDPGTYEYYCSVPGHREGGMVGKLVVE